MRALFILQLLLLFTFNEKFGFCFPTGAGWSACYDLKPGFNPHGAGNTDESPYNVSLSDMTYDSNTTEITVTIGKIASNTTGFKGFVVGAFDADNNPVGEFKAGTNNKLMCDFNTHTCHINGDVKDKVELKWKPPATPVGNIVFKASIVQTVQVFWLSVASPALKGPGTAKKRDPPNPAGTTNFKFNFNECGSSKGCLRIPSDCDAEDKCFAVIFWKDSAEEIEFDMSVTADSRSMAVGFSKDDKMGDDSIFGCFIKEDFASFGHRNYIGKFEGGRKSVEKKTFDNTLSLVEASYDASSRLRCKIKRKKFLANKENEFFNISSGNSYHLMASFSNFSVEWPTYDGLYYHYYTKVITDKKISIDHSNDIKMSFKGPPTTKPPSGSSQELLPYFGVWNYMIIAVFFNIKLYFG